MNYIRIKYQQNNITCFYIRNDDYLEHVKRHKNIYNDYVPFNEEKYTIHNQEISAYCVFGYNTKLYYTNSPHIHEHFIFKD